MVRTRNKPLLNNYVPDLTTTSSNSNLEYSVCNTNVKSKPVARRQSSSKKVFNSGSKSGSFLGDYVVDHTFIDTNQPVHQA